VVRWWLAGRSQEVVLGKSTFAPLRGGYGGQPPAEAGGGHFCSGVLEFRLIREQSQERNFLVLFGSKKNIVQLIRTALGNGRAALFRNDDRRDGL
jgi:hypothetical protein